MSSALKILVTCVLSMTLWVSAPGISSAQDQQEGGRRERGGERGGPGRGGQGGRPSFGGFGRRGGGLMGEIGNESTRGELNISDEQIQKLTEIGESMGNNREMFTDVFSRMRAAESDEEREKIRNEMRTKMEEVRTQAETKMKSVLSEDQFKRLDQIRLHREGSRALGRDDVQNELGLSDEQKKKLEALAEERGARFRELGFGASEEDRNKLREELEQKTLGVLTADQKAKWQQRLGPPPADAGQPRRPGGRTGGNQDQPRRERPVMIEEAPEGAEAVLSFGGKAETLDAAGNRDRTNVQLSFNFRYAPWTEVLRLFARESGLSLDLLDVPPGTFSYFDQKSYTPNDALDVLNGYLLPKGFVLVHRDDFLVCLNIDDPIPPNLIPHVKPEDLVNRGRNELLTVTFPLEGLDASQIAAEVNEVKGPQGSVVALTSQNSILVTDIGSNLRRIDEMLKDASGRPGPDDMSFTPYQIKNLPATEAEGLLRGVLGIGSGVANVSANFDSRSRSRSSSSSSMQITIATDERTNKLLISTTTKIHQLIEQALLTIDVEGEASSFSASANKPFLRVYSVTSADAREVVKTIDALMPGIVVNEDGRNGKIHIMASPDKHAEVGNLIQQMDGMGTNSQQMTVIPLSKMDPLTAAATVQAMFLKDGEMAPTIQPDVFGRQLMIRGDANQILQIKGLLAQLGEDGTGQRDSSSDSRIRTFPLSGRDPEELLPLIQRMWEQRSSSKIRIVNPIERGPVRDIKSPGQGQSVRDAQEAPIQPTSTERSEPDRPDRESVRSKPVAKPRSVPVLTASQTTVIAQLTESTSEPESPQPKANPLASDPNELSDNELLDLLENYVNKAGSGDNSAKQTKPQVNPVAPMQQQRPAASAKPPGDINITIIGDELLMTSQDSSALNEFEELLESTMQVIPPRTSWTVFTLQTADATEAAMMLEQLLPYSNVSVSSSGGGMLGSLTGAASSLGSGLADMTGLSSIAAAGQTLRIIPDTRLNSLFVSGPSSQVKEVEEMLRVLDANEWPDSLRDKITRMIPVEYADANDVLKIVKDTYKVYIDPPQQQQQNRNNPLAAMMGGGGRSSSRNGNSPESLIKMAVSVDTNTNHLAVWADESLFREVESLVQSIDKAAQEARRTVRVVPLLSTNSSVIQNALGTLMPRVNVSSTGSRSSNTNSNNNSSSNSGASGQDQERIRQFFEQRMRERMQQGGGGGRPSGFGGGGRPGGDSGGGRPSTFGGGRPGGGRPGGR